MTTLMDFTDEKPKSLFESVKQIAKSGLPFNSTHVRNARPEANGHAVAAILSVLKQEKKIEPYEKEPVDSQGPNSHGSRPVPWWIATPELLLEKQ